MNVVKPNHEPMRKSKLFANYYEGLKPGGHTRRCAIPRSVGPMPRWLAPSLTFMTAILLYYLTTPGCRMR